MEGKKSINQGSGCVHNLPTWVLSKESWSHSSERKRLQEYVFLIIVHNVCQQQLNAASPGQSNILLNYLWELGRDLLVSYMTIRLSLSIDNSEKSHLLIKVTTTDLIVIMLSFR